jgi:mRNA interferase RelE/StbE
VERQKIWEIVLTKPVEKAYDKSILSLQKRIDKCFEELEKNPIYGSNIKTLTGNLNGLYRYRIGDWRIIYRVMQERMVVEIIAILSRGSAY